MDVSVIISTFNRCDELRGTLESVLSQAADGCRYEVIVADNNSSDGTRDTVSSFVERGHANLRYVFEGQQGVSYGRNAGIRMATAPILAFTDDDVIVERDWIASIKRAFDANPDVDYVTGKMLPIYDVPPASWLTSDHTGPCVLRNRGDSPVYSEPGHFFPGWATANIAFRRSVFTRVGFFAGDFPRGQDLEFIVRLWRVNGRGMYAPDVVVRHHIPAERMTKAYHRMWHVREGDIRARIRFREIFDANGRILRDTPPSPMLFGVPAFIYRDLLLESASWVAATARFNEGQRFLSECKVRQTVSYLRTRFRQNARERQHSQVAEVASFVKALIRRKWKTRSLGPTRTVE